MVPATVGMIHMLAVLVLPKEGIMGSGYIF
jgi:hypothetical protein